MSNVSVGLTEQCFIFLKPPRTELYTYVRNQCTVTWKVLGFPFFKENMKRIKSKLEIFKKNLELYTLENESPLIM